MILMRNPQIVPFYYIVLTPRPSKILSHVSSIAIIITTGSFVGLRPLLYTKSDQVERYKKN